MNLEMFVRFAIKRKLKNLGENFGDDKFNKFQFIEQNKITPTEKSVGVISLLSAYQIFVIRRGIL